MTSLLFALCLIFWDKIIWHDNYIFFFIYLDYASLPHLDIAKNWQNTSTHPFHMRLSIQEKNKYEKCDDLDSVASDDSWPRWWSLTLCKTTLVSKIGKPVKAKIKFAALKSKLAKSWTLFTNSGMFAKKWRSLQKNKTYIFYKYNQHYYLFQCQKSCN